MCYVTSAEKKNDVWNNSDCYVKNISSFQTLFSISLDNPVTFFVGENGSGKSTLLEAIAVNYGFNPEGGSKNYNFSTKNTHSAFSDMITLTKAPKKAKDGFFLRAESFYNTATYMEEIDTELFSPSYLDSFFEGKSLHDQSHGESFISMVNNRFWGNGLYILDEPEAALSPSRQLTLISHIGRLVKANSQFIIATHSPILLAFPNALIYSFDDGKITKTNYKNTSHYQITRDFLNNPSRMLDILLE